MRTAKDLRPLQREAIDFSSKNMKSMWLLSMGAGKTGAALQLLNKLMNHDFSLGRCIIIAPKLVANTVWQQEAEKWAETRGLKITLCMDDGGDKWADRYGNTVDGRKRANRERTDVKKMSANERRRRKVASDHDILVINPAKLGWLRKNCKWRWDGVIIDESSKFKSQASIRWLYLADGKYGILRYLRFMLLLTGTPLSNGYLDLWSQIYLVDRGKRLGKDITMFRRQHFDNVNTGAPFASYVLRKGHDEIIKDKVADICFAKKIARTTEEPVPFTEWIEPPAAADKRYRELQRESLIEVDGVEIETPNAGSTTNKLLQMCNGFIYDEHKVAHLIHTAKTDRLAEIREDNRGENMVVCYNFKEDVVRLLDKFPEAVVLDKNGSQVDAWNRREIPMLLCHPARAGHGLNLQFGGSLQIWYGLTWSLENYLQMNKRLDREGQLEQVRIMHLAMKGWVDERLLKAVGKKFRTQKDFIDYVVRHHN